MLFRSLWPDPIRTLGAKGDKLAPPWPDLLIATGRLTVAPALAVKRHSGGRCFCVQLQNPGAARALDYDFIEIQGAPSYDFGVASATASVSFSPQYFADSGDALYTSLAVDVPLGRYFTLSGQIGRQQIDDNAAFGTPDYVDYSIGISANVLGFDVDLRWTDTDMSKSECDDPCGMAVFTVSRSF